MKTHSSNISLYIHYPFCKSKCPYCDFNSFCFTIDEEKLINAYQKELDFYGEILKNRTIETIYFGGGTPILMSEKLLESILNKISCDGEISMEANPNSISYEKLKNFKNIGINRLSIGIQSLNDKDLKFLGRTHNRAEGLKAIENARKIFKDRYSIDMIYSRPNQNLQEWGDELQEAITLSPHHISAYQLIIEKGTMFARQKIQEQNENLSAKFYNTTNKIMEKNGLNFYEISNYAQFNYECKHNIVYWKSGEWIGIGAGAHGRLNVGNKRYAIQNVKNPLQWVKKVKTNGNGISVKTKLNADDIRSEKILMGLRTKQGINMNGLELKNIDMLSKEGLVVLNKDWISLTNKGFLLLNKVVEKLI
ncbi:MAG: radical SAM family heme chaperone HemW [Rickettsiales bacterium]|jgi:oxygen-independent coproporphyrinogen-3 oxidase|nr:radical SAM family heme chaperone HemW [Rickettsiales bacterium]